MPNLPRLAWGVRLRRNESAVRVLHGPWVEVRKNCFFEGAWDGPFESADFDQALTLAGSGGRLTDSGIVFAGPTHMYERLHSLRVNNELFVSNSLAFLLALTGERLDPGHPHYHLNFLDFHRIGLSVTDKRLRLAGAHSSAGKFVALHDCCNLAINPDLTISRVEKTLGPPPRDYRDYVSFLERTLENVMRNAAHRDRLWSYRPVTMISQGYDSTAVSALAAKAGCREAVTFYRSNSARGYIDDSGKAIAERLGLQVTEYERTEYEKLPERRDDEFYLEPWGIDRNLVLMERQLEGSLLLAGRCGDALWPRGGCTRWWLPGDNGLPLFQQPADRTLGGSALGEFRMMTGFIHFPLACSGALHAPAIHAISNSREMKPWSIGGGYDRPIGRRIVEEAGVPREMFGQLKKGGPLLRRPGRRTLARRMVSSLQRLSRWTPLMILNLRIFGNRFHPMWSRGSFAVQQGVERTMERYRSAMSTGDR